MPDFGPSHGSAAHAIGRDFGIDLSQRSCGALFQIAGWGDDFQRAVTPHLGDLGLMSLGNFREVQRAGEFSSYRIAPDRILLRAPHMAGLQSALSKMDPQRCAVLDLSDAKSSWHIAGPSVEHVLAQCMAIDFDLSAFPVNGFVQAGFHHMGCLVHRHTAMEFEILVPSSYAQFAGEALSECA